MSNSIVVELVFYSFSFISLCLVFWGITKKDRVYQYPFFMGFAFVSFILPQAAALIKNFGSVPERSVQQVLIMSCLCAGMCWLGYQLPLPSAWIGQSNWHLDRKRLKIGAFIYVCIGLIFWILVYSSPEAASLSQYWSGKITIYVFFGNLLNIGFTVLLLEVVKKVNLLNIVLFSIPFTFVFFRAVYAGRRTSMVFLVFSIACALFFIRRLVIPRMFFLVGMVLTAFLIVSIGQYRHITSTGQWNKVAEINPIENLQILLDEDQQKTLELRNAAALIESVNFSRSYQLGTTYWNTLIFRFIPSQLLGSEFKDSFKLDFSNVNYQDIAYYNYGYIHQKGSTFTGMGDTFAQFDYIGCLVFAMIAVLSKTLWVKSLSGDYIAQMGYILMLPSCMLVVTHGSSGFPSDCIYYMLFSSPLILWSRRKKIRISV